MNFLFTNDKQKMLRTVAGNLLEAKEDYIVHQCNCYTVTSHGLSKTIADCFPWANHYATRRRLGRRNLAIEEDRDKFGSIKVIQGPNGGGVVCLFAQLCPGKPGHYHSYPNWQIDTKEERLAKFKSCLRKLGRFCQQGEDITVAFPYKIGCGLAGGDWNQYFDAIKHFVEKYNIDATIYKL
uniref:Macro domain-containing protein n=1 Tax=viral metagenome TaxID=1070528 RepID=A0A6C0EKS2_9ZZZZ